MRFLKFVILAAVLASGCKKPPVEQGSAVKAGTGADSLRPHWLMSPEFIAGTITRTWGIKVTEDETKRYFSSVHGLLGGTSVARRGVLLTKPNELYTLTLDNVASWVGSRIVEKQSTLEGGASEDAAAPFTGYEGSVKIPDAALCKACFEDDSKEWCDCRDGVTHKGMSAGSVTVATLRETSGKGKELRKRLMHNIQDIGEYLNCSAGVLDNRLKIGAESTSPDATKWLLDEVFLKTYEDGANEAAEKKAWGRVFHTVLMGQGCFLRL